MLKTFIATKEIVNKASHPYTASVSFSIFSPTRRPVDNFMDVTASSYLTIRDHCKRSRQA